VPVPEEYQNEWPIWRLVMNGFVTLTEIKESYTLADIFNANEVLTLKLLAEAEAGEN